LPPCISNLFRSMRGPHRPSRLGVRLNDLQSVRSALLLAVVDCNGLPTERLQLKIRSARNHRDLWMLRSDAYHLIALSHCQTVAEQRIGGLLPLFVGWVAPQELSRVP
jgi:hypothetical protein